LRQNDDDAILTLSFIGRSPGPVWYARVGVTDRDAEKRRSPVLAGGAAGEVINHNNDQYCG